MNKHMNELGQLSSSKREILQRMMLERSRNSATLSSIQPRSENGPALLSYAQQRLWFLHHLDLSSSLYNIHNVVRLYGKLNVCLLERSLKVIIERHALLRIRIYLLDEQPVQDVTDARDVKTVSIDFSTIPITRQQLDIKLLINDEIARPFDLEHGPLLRTFLLRLQPEEHIFVLTMHHIISDAWSQGIFFRELVALYTAFSRGEASPLTPLPIQYADYALWQRQWFQGDVLERQLTYWKTQLAAAPDFLALPTDHPRPALQRYQGASSTRLFPQTLCAELLVLSRKEQVTLFMTVLSAFQILLMRYSGQTDILVGTSIANRHHLEIEPLIGFFVNTLVLRTSLAGDPTVRELLARVRQVALGAYAHQDLPFEQLVDALQPQRNLSHAPLFQVLFLFQNVPFERVELPELQLQSVDTENTTAKFDLTLTVTELPEGLRVAVEYNTDLFETTTIQRLLGHLQTVLQAMVRDPQQTIGTLPLLTEAERQQMMVTWNATRNDGVSPDCLHELFERQVERTPEAIALVCGQEQITYTLLNQRANQLARSLQSVGVGPEMVVGLCLLRSLEMLIGLLAILKAGGAYLPLDPSYPQERLAFMLADAQATVLLTQQALLDRWASSDVISICLDRDRSLFTQFSTHNLACDLRQEHLAYVIYTSGSTGRPKGVMVTHHNVMNLFVFLDEQLGADPIGSWLALTSISFDISVLELFWTLSQGYRVIVAEQTREYAIASQLQIHGITHLQCTPSLGTLLSAELTPENVPDLRVCLLGGEALSIALVTQLRTVMTGSIYNMYGPTETTIWSSVERVAPNEREITLGRPVSNTTIYLLDEHYQLVPVGVIGEIYIGGAGVTRGYLGRPELTAQRFLPHPFSQEAGVRLYRTGDLARYHQDGKIEFLGRKDQQVKLHGFRIELEEIETKLECHTDVRKSIVVVQEGGMDMKQLVAYIILSNNHIDYNKELRAFLRDNLPDYMIPSLFITVQSFPLLPNGKIDRRSLQSLIPLQKEVSNSIPEKISINEASQRSSVESRILTIYQNFLRVEQINIEENLFDQGIHSLIIVRAYLEIKKAFHLEFPMLSMFKYPTIRSIAEYITNCRGDDDTMKTFDVEIKNTTLKRHEIRKEKRSKRHL